MLFTLFTINQLDERDELQSELARDVVRVIYIANRVEILLDFPWSQCFCDWIGAQPCARLPNEPKAWKLGLDLWRIFPKAAMKSGFW